MVERIPVAMTFQDPTFPLKIETTVLDGGFKVHTHEFTELVVIFQGTGTHVAEGKRYRVGPGDVWVLQGMQSHGFEDCRGLGLYNAMFVPERLPLPMAQFRGIPGYHALFILEPMYRQHHQFKSRLELAHQDMEGILPLLAGGEANLSGGLPGGQALALSSFIHIVVALSRAYGEVERQPSRDLMRLATVLSAIESDCSAAWTLSDMSAMAHMSPNQFIRVFKAAMGRSPMDHLIALRIRQASEILLSRDMSITEAALHVGFSDPGYFARQFKRHTGVTPTVYKEAGGCP